MICYRCKSGIELDLSGLFLWNQGYVKTVSIQKIHLRYHLVLLTDFGSHSLMIWWTHMMQITAHILVTTQGFSSNVTLSLPSAKVNVYYACDIRSWRRRITRWAVVWRKWHHSIAEHILYTQRRIWVTVLNYGRIEEEPVLGERLVTEENTGV
mgnify:CR=1 FL=1